MSRFFERQQPKPEEKGVNYTPKTFQKLCADLGVELWKGVRIMEYLKARGGVKIEEEFVEDKTMSEDVTLRSLRKWVEVNSLQGYRVHRFPVGKLNEKLSALVEKVEKIARSKDYLYLLMVNNPDIESSTRAVKRLIQKEILGEEE